MNNKTTGFEVFDTIMENCLSINNGLFGIDAERSSILQCSVLDNANHYGMYANESIIINCNIAGNKNGMYILNKNQIRYNNIRNSQWYGMFVTGVNNYITHNSASGNISIDYYIINNNNTNYIPMLTDGDNANLSW